MTTQDNPNEKPSWRSIAATQIRRHWPKLACALIGAIAANALTIVQAAKALGGAPVEPSFYAYYNDKSDKEYTIKEPLYFKTTEQPGGVLELHGESTATVRDGHGATIQKKWVNHGFQTSDRLVYCYFASAPKMQGAGAYYLTRNGNDWIGFWVGKDQITGDTIKAPAVLTNENLTEEQAVAKFAELKTPAILIPQMKIP